MKGKVGPKQKLSKELIGEICGYVWAGMTNKDACILSNISESVLYRWLQDNEKTKDKENKTNYEQLTQELFESLKKAQTGFKMQHVKNINLAGAESKNWMASAWMLERKFHDEFGKKDKLDIQGDVTINVKITD